MQLAAAAQLAALNVITEDFDHCAVGRNQSAVGDVRPGWKWALSPENVKKRNGKVEQSAIHARSCSEERIRCSTWQRIPMLLVNISLCWITLRFCCESRGAASLDHDDCYRCYGVCWRYTLLALTLCAVCLCTSCGLYYALREGLVFDPRPHLTLLKQMLVKKKK